MHYEKCKTDGKTKKKQNGSKKNKKNTLMFIFENVS